MTLWDARFKAHPLWAVVAELRGMMNTVQMPESPDDREVLTYAGGVLELLEKRRDDTDAREVSPTMLATAQSAADNFRSALNNVVGGAWPWGQVTAPVDDVVTALAQWPPMKIAHYLSGLSSATDAFQAKTSEALSRTSTHATEVEQQVTGLGQRVEGLTAEVADQTKRISEAIADFTTKSAEAVRDLLDKQQDRITASEEEWSKHLTEQLAKADEHNAQMAEYERQSLKVLEAVGTNSTATDYGSYSTSQNKAANQWRRIASIVFAAAGAWFIASSFPWFTSSAATWESSLSRLGVTAAVAGVGAYAARESSQHRRQAREAKKVQLVLLALEPFIANMPEESRNTVREEAARAIFVIQPEPPETEQSSTAALDIFRDLLSKLPSTSGH